MRSVTENISEKEHRWATRELQVLVEAIPAVATGTGFVHVTGGAQDAAASTATQTTALLDTFTALLKGLAPPSGGGTANFLRADGTWAAPVAANPRVFVSEQTGTGPWTWSSLNGDETGLRGYEIVFRLTNAGFAANEPRLRFNGDTGANYTDGGGVAVTSARLGNPSDLDLGGANAAVQGSIFVTSARSGAYRGLTGMLNASDDTPFAKHFFPDSAWMSTAAITSISVIMASGSVDAGVLALYKLMDVP